MTRRLQRRSFLVAALALTFLSAGCGELFGDPNELLAVNIPVTISAPFSLPVQVPSTGLEQYPTLDDGSIELPPIEIYQPIDLSSYTGEVSSPDQIDSITIEAVTAIVEGNTLNIPIAPIELRVGAQEDDFDSALVVAITDEIPPGFNGEQPATVIEDNREAAGERIADVQFGMGFGVQMVIPAGVVPSGDATISFELDLNIKIKPL